MDKAEAVIRLETLVESYAENKSLADDYKKICDNENKEIKKIMQEHNITDCYSQNYVVKYYTQTRESMNEVKLLSMLKRENLTKAIKTVEIVDMDALESMLYNEEIPNALMSEMATFKETKVIPVIKVSKRRKENADNR